MTAAKPKHGFSITFDACQKICICCAAQRLGAEDYEALNIYGKKDAKAAEKMVFKHFPGMNKGPRDGASYWQARHDLLAAASGVSTKDMRAEDSPEKQPDSGGVMNWLRNLFSN